MREKLKITLDDWIKHSPDVRRCMQNDNKMYAMPRDNSYHCIKSSNCVFQKYIKTDGEISNPKTPICTRRGYYLTIETNN